MLLLVFWGTYLQASRSESMNCPLLACALSIMSSIPLFWKEERQHRFSQYFQHYDRPPKGCRLSLYSRIDLWWGEDRWRMPFFIGIRTAELERKGDWVRVREGRSRVTGIIIIRHCVFQAMQQESFPLRPRRLFLPPDLRSRMYEQMDPRGTQWSPVKRRNLRNKTLRL